MFGLGRENGKSLYGALFDVGSESVGVAIVASHTGDTYPKILFAHRVYMRTTRRGLSLEERIRAMKEALFSASLIISRDGLAALLKEHPHARVSKILVSSSTPWSYTLSRNVQYAHEEEFRVTKELIHDLVGSAEKEIAQHITTAVLPTELTYEIVERATIDVRINDYPVSNPLNLKGKEISLVHVTGLIPKEVTQALDEVRDKIFPHTEIHAHTFMLMLHCVLREMYRDHESLLAVHVSGDATEFGIVEGDTLVESISIPIGLNSIVSDLMKHETETSKEMYTLLGLYEAGELHEEEGNRVRKALETYQACIEDALVPYTHTRRLPKTTFVLAPTSFTPLFARIYESLFKKLLHIEEAPYTLSDAVMATNGENHDDATLTIIGRFFHKLHACGEIDQS